MKKPTEEFLVSTSIRRRKILCDGVSTLKRRCVSTEIQ